MKKLSSIIIAALSGLATLHAHPQPDIPVNSFFDGSNGMELKVELDPRCWAADPNTAPYLTNKDLRALPEPEMSKLKDKALSFAKEALELVFEPNGAADMKLALEFTTLAGKPLAKDEDPVVITATWKTMLPDGAASYRLRALKTTKMAIVFHHYFKGRALERFGILFPGETSYALDLHTLASAKLAE